MNKDYISDIRYCEKYQHSETFLHLDMFQKKIRKKMNHQYEQINAQVKLRQIYSFWKEGWQDEHFHPFILNPAAVNINIIINESDKYSYTNNYDEIIKRFSLRYKTQQQDQSTYKIYQQPFKKLTDYSPDNEQFLEAKKNIINILSITEKLTEEMFHKMSEHEHLYIIQKADTFAEVNKEYYWQIYKSLKFINTMSKQYKNNCKQLNEASNFVSQFTTQIENIIKSKKGSTLFTVQPQIQHMTYIIHPVLLSIQNYLFKESKKNKIKLSEQKMISEPISCEQNILPQVNINNDYNSNKKIAFINLDGYESQFNLQFIRHLKDHLLYISFPKDDKIQTEQQLIYSRRFYKKLMFNYSKINFDNDNQDVMQLIQKLTYDPQNYYQNVEKIYPKNMTENIQELNKNMYIIPIRCKSLRQNFKQILGQYENIQKYQSYLLRFLFKNFLINQIREFDPALVIVSWSGRIIMEQNHFTELIQQLTKVSNYKLIFYPNLTTLFCQNELPQIQDEEDLSYDNIINDPKIHYLQPQIDKIISDESNQIPSIYLLGIISRYIKISSGTYNLTENYQQLSLIDKYKNSKIFKYSYDILNVLGNQYPSIKAIKPNKYSLISQTSFYEDNLKSSLEILEKTVPIYYKKLWNILQSIIFDQQTSLIKQLKQLQIDVQIYRNQIRTIKQVVLASEYQQAPENSLKQNFNQYKFLNFLQLSNEKYHDRTHLFIKDTKQYEYYNKDVYQNKMNSLHGIYFLSFYNQRKQNIFIDQTTKILYKTNQSNCPYFPVLIINNVDLQQPKMSSYIALVKKNNIHFKSQRCQAEQINFTDQSNNPFEIKCQWNYHQTQTNMILYWPTKYDCIRANLYKIINKKYQPKILRDIYIAKKLRKQDNLVVTFRKIDFISLNDFEPRIGCSAYNVNNKIFIFGGFYQQQKNYLNLQHEVTTFDLINYLEQNGKIIINNEKMNLYSKEKNTGPTNANSFIKPRIHFQFYEADQLQEQAPILQNKKSVIMIGGHGQNFVRPFSLLTYFYYKLTFDIANSNLQSVQKKIIYNKAVPINLNEMVKNKNFHTKMNIFDENDQLLKISYPNSQHFMFHRVAYKIHEQNFNFKIKTLYGIEKYPSYKDSYKQFARKLGQIRSKPQIQSINIISINDVNHYVVITQGKKSFLISLYYEYSSQNQKTQVKLTNEAILSIQIKNNKIFALIKHEYYTADKCILAICDIVFPNYQLNEYQDFQVQSRVLSIILKPIHIFNEELCMHILIACNQTHLILLHGTLLEHNNQISQYSLKLKYNPEKLAFEVKKINNFKPMTLTNTEKKQCETFIIKKDHKIDCYTVYTNKKDPEIICISYQMINMGQLTINWVYDQVNDSCLRFIFGIKQANAMKIFENIKILQIRKQQNQTILCLLKYQNSEYKARLHKQSKTIYKNIEVYQCQIATTTNYQKNWKQAYNSRKIVKTLQKYQDYYN